MLKDRIMDLLFPRKCVLCGKVLNRKQDDLCDQCRKDAEDFSKANKKISFVAGWTALWYYNENVRISMLRYKFYHRQSYGSIYGRLLAIKLHRTALCDYDILTWVPISQRRKWKRGYEQVQLIAQSTGQQLGTPAVSTLRKTRHTNPQSRLSDASHRRANILGAYAVPDPSIVAGKRILLLDDIITTGSTVSECAKTLLTAGAKEVYCAAIAAPHNKNNKRR